MEAIIQSANRELRTGRMLHRKIKCPRHYLLKPGGRPFVMQRKPSLKNIKEADLRRLGIDPWMPVKDRFGRKIQNFKDYIQPFISAAEAKLRIYKEDNHICNSCRRCVTA